MADTLESARVATDGSASAGPAGAAVSVRRKPLRDVQCPDCRAILLAREGPAVRTSKFELCLRRCDACGVGFSNTNSTPLIIRREAPEVLGPSSDAGARPTGFVLLQPDHSLVRSDTPGQLGGFWPGRIYGRLDCRAAQRALKVGGLTHLRVFFADKCAAIAAGFRPCWSCMRPEYLRWKAAQKAKEAPSAGLRKEPAESIVVAAWPVVSRCEEGTSASRPLSVTATGKE